MGDEHYKDQGLGIERMAANLSEYTIPEFNRLTIALANLGIAVTFSQYIPELHDEIPAAEETNRESDPNLDNAFGGREPG